MRRIRKDNLGNVLPPGMYQTPVRQTFAASTGTRRYEHWYYRLLRQVAGELIDGGTFKDYKAAKAAMPGFIRMTDKMMRREERRRARSR